MGDRMGRLIGYARVSSPEQSMELQIDELTAACKKIYADEISRVRAESLGQDGYLELLRAGDILIVWLLGQLK